MTDTRDNMPPASRTQDLALARFLSGETTDDADEAPRVAEVHEMEAPPATQAETPVLSLGKLERVTFTVKNIQITLMCYVLVSDSAVNLTFLHSNGDLKVPKGAVVTIQSTSLREGEFVGTSIAFPLAQPASAVMRIFDRKQVSKKASNSALLELGQKLRHR